jgi:hypothetical protein
MEDLFVSAASFARSIRLDGVHLFLGVYTRTWLYVLELKLRHFIYCTQLYRNNILQAEQNQICASGVLGRTEGFVAADHLFAVPHAFSCMLHFCLCIRFGWSEQEQEHEHEHEHEHAEFLGRE